MNNLLLVFVDKELLHVFVLLYLMMRVLFLEMNLLKNLNDDIWDKTMELIQEVLQQSQHIPFIIFNKILFLYIKITNQ